MKTYQKPALLALSLSANDMLCSGCSKQTRFDAELNNFFKALGFDTDGDGILEPGEGGLFAESESDCNTYYDGYCKFTAADEGLTQLFTS